MLSFKIVSLNLICEGLARALMAQLTGSLRDETLPSRMPFSLCNFPWPMLKET